MADLPIAGYMTDDARTEAEFKTALEDQRGVIEQVVGGAAEELMTLASGTFIPTSCANAIANEGGASTDTLSNISTVSMPSGRIVIIRPNASATSLIIEHAAGGSGQIIIPQGNNRTLSDPDERAVLQNRGGDWHLLFVTGGSGFMMTSKTSVSWNVAVYFTAGPISLTIPDSIGRVLIEARGGGGSGASGSGSVPGGGGGGGGIGRWLLDTSGGGSIGGLVGSGGPAAAAGGNDGNVGTSTTVTWSGAGGGTMAVPAGGAGQDDGLGATPSSVPGGQPSAALVEPGTPGGHGSVIGANEFGGPGGGVGGGQTRRTADGDDGTLGGGGAGGSSGELGGAGGSGYVIIYL